MLKNLEGKEMKRVPHGDDFEMVLDRLGTARAEQARSELNRIIDELPPAGGMPRRAFNSTHLGSNLSPWTSGLKHLYDVAVEILGDTAPDEIIEGRAALIFGLFVWECMMHRDEEWHFWDPNLSARDPNREPMGKFYFEVDR